VNSKILGFGLVLGAGVVAQTAHAQFVVINTNDAGAGCLRTVLSNAPANATITFATNLSGQTILLTNSTLVLSNNVTIDASGLPGGIQISPVFGRLLYVQSNATVVLDSLTLAHGYIPGQSGVSGISPPQPGQSVLGGGVYNAGTLTLNNVILTGNSVLGGQGANGVPGPTVGTPGGVGGDGSGGGIYNAGTLTLNQTAVSGNSASGGVGGNGGNGPSGSDGGAGGAGGSGNGGAIYNAGVLTLSGTTFSGNSAVGGSGGNGGNVPGGTAVAPGMNGGAGGDGSGGGIFNAGTLIVNEATVAADSALGGSGGNPGKVNSGAGPFVGSGGSGGSGYGGAIYNTNTLTINQATLASNSVAAGAAGSGNFTNSATNVGGGVFNSQSLSLFNSIVAGNAASSAANISGSFTVTGNSFTNGNPDLAPLGYYGGPTQTMPPLPGSPAVDAGSDSATNTFATDQRGSPRLSGLHVDIGAAESIISPPLLTGLSIEMIATNTANGTRTVQLGAVVNPYGWPATVNFQYGLTLAYGGNDPVNVPAILSASNLFATITLSADLNYHWNVVATTVAGVNTAPDQTFFIPSPYIAGDLTGQGYVSQADLNAVYSNYLNTSPWLAMTNVTGLGRSNVTFSLSNSIVGGYSVQYSTNLVDWYYLGPATPQYIFTDTNAPASPERYYRLSYP
jgi:hypothetical protein